MDLAKAHMDSAKTSMDSSTHALAPANGPQFAPAPGQLPWSDRLPPDTDIAIIGGGFSGLMTLVNAVRHCPTARIVLLERRPNRTPGVAYGACDPVHLLNVPANRMGASSDDVAGFHAWLEAHHPGVYGAGDFAPRRLYGQYLLEFVAARLEGAWNRVCLVRDAVVHMDHAVDGIELLTASGRTCMASCIVLAPGIPPARAPWALVAAGAPRSLLMADPWDTGAFDGVPADSPVLIVGSGLTAIDVVIALRERGHKGRVTLVSRNGKLPLPHAQPGEAAHQFTRNDLAGSPAAVMGAIRRAARARMNAGLGWQGALDAVRPFTAEVWRQWSTADRQRFLRHARPVWEVHRHRVPRAVLAVLDELRHAGRLDLVRGHLTHLDGGEQGTVRVTVAVQGGPARTLEVARVFNCIGPATSVRQTADPLLRSLLMSGMAASDASGLGLLADGNGHVLGENGLADQRIFLVGALRRADSWESTAVPELRVQSEKVAERVAAVLAAADGGAVARARRSLPAYTTAGGCG